MKRLLIGILLVLMTGCAGEKQTDEHDTNINIYIQNLLKEIEE